MDRPWFQFHTRDWLDNKELRRCSAAARGILADLMCLVHEGKPYGHLADSVGALTDEYLASRCVVSLSVFRKAVAELLTAGRLNRTDTGVMFVPRMVRDEQVRLARAAGGSLGGNPTLTPKVGSKDNLRPNLTPQPSGANQGYPHSRARIRADSESDSSGEGEEVEEKGGDCEALRDEIIAAHPGLRRTPGRARIWLNDVIASSPNAFRVLTIIRRWQIAYLHEMNGDVQHTKSLINCLTDHDWEVDPGEITNGQGEPQYRPAAEVEEEQRRQDAEDRAARIAAGWVDRRGSGAAGAG